MNFYTLSLNLSQHDSSVAVFENDQLVFFNQAERYTKIKHDFIISIDVIKYILENITNTIDILVVGSHLTENKHVIEFILQHFKTDTVIINRNLSDECIKIIKENGIEYLTHHNSHAMSAFYMSPFDEAVCLIVDALGSPFNIPNNKSIKQNQNGINGSETTSILEISKNYKIKTLYKRAQTLPVTLTNINDKILPISNIGVDLLSLSENPINRFYNQNYKFETSTNNDIGIMYDTISLHLKFGIFGSGKVMGLSAYGKEDATLPPFLVNDTIYSNSNLFCLGRELNHILYPELFGEISFEKKANLAYSVQKALEKIFLHHIEFIKQNSKIKNLVIGGGCALNILGVSLIKKHYPEFNIFVDPIAHDATHAIGEGIHFYNILGTKCKLEKKNNFNSIYLGPKYDEQTMNSQIDEYIRQC